MPGYRSGFVAGDADVIAALRRFRPNTGALSQTFVQRAAVAAWEDEAHVAEVRARYRAKRDVLAPALRAAGRAAGMDGHLTKPLQRAVLLAELARVVPA